MQTRINKKPVASRFNLKAVLTKKIATKMMNKLQTRSLQARSIEGLIKVIERETKVNLSKKIDQELMKSDSLLAKFSIKETVL